MKYLIFFFSLIVPFIGYGKSTISNKEIENNISAAWECVWMRFYHPETQQFYDYISSYQKGLELSHLPTTQQVKRQYPNPCGYGTGMEDCVILGGTMLSAIIDEYEATQNPALKTNILNVFEGVKRSANIPESPGFVARGICIEDGKSYYYNSSRDQYTHCVHGLWRFYNSALSDDRQKEEIRFILSTIADRMHKNVTSANHFDFLRADGKECPLGICRMWNVQPHEAARLPMFYAAAWDVTGNKRYYELYRQYIEEAIKQSENIGNDYSGYVYLQMLSSFELLYKLESDTSLKNKLNKLMLKVEKMSLQRAQSCKKELLSKNKMELSVLGPDWRLAKNWDIQNGYLIPRWGEYRKVWHLVREAGESLLVVFMVDNPIHSATKKELLNEIISYMDYTQTSGCGIFFHIAAYWKAQNKADL